MDDRRGTRPVKTYSRYTQRFDPRWQRRLVKQVLNMHVCIQDQVVRDARGGGAQSDNLHDFNPFSSEQTQTKVGISITLYTI